MVGGRAVVVSGTCSASKRPRLEAFVAGLPSKRLTLSEEAAKASKLFMASSDNSTNKKKKTIGGGVVEDCAFSKIEAKVMKKENIHNMRAGDKSTTAAASKARESGNHIHRVEAAMMRQEQRYATASPSKQRLLRPAVKNEQLRVRPQIKLLEIHEIPNIRQTDPPRKMLPTPPHDESKSRRHREPPRRAAPQACKTISQQRQLDREAARRALQKVEEEAAERFNREGPLRPEDILQILPSLGYQYLHSRPRPAAAPARKAAVNACKAAPSAQSNKLNASPTDDIEKARSYEKSVPKYKPS